MRKPTCLKLLALVLMAALVALPALGCSRLPKIEPPPGFEASALWASGFMPMGPVLIRGGLHTLVILEPQTKAPVLVALTHAKAALEAGGLEEGLDYVAKVFLAFTGDPLYEDIALVALHQLYKVADLPEAVLEPCDKEIILEMIDQCIQDLYTVGTIYEGVDDPIILEMTDQALADYAAGLEALR